MKFNSRHLNTISFKEEDRVDITTRSIVSFYTRLLLNLSLIKSSEEYRLYQSLSLKNDNGQ